MACEFLEVCGGCRHRQLNEEAYRELKIENFKQALGGLKTELKFGEPIFIPDQTRRRACLAFEYRKGKLTFGFNEARSHNLVNLNFCPLLTPQLNENLDNIRRLIEEICAIPMQVKSGKKMLSTPITKGDVWLTAADNGIDVVLEFPGKLELGHRMVVFELAHSFSGIVRISWRAVAGTAAEPLVEKTKPFITAGSFPVYIPAGTFLQPSAAGQEALSALVLKYLGETDGNIADLFCGVGTFSYALAEKTARKITAVDSSAELLQGFRESLNSNMIPNINIVTRNLFKYPLKGNELKDFSAVVFDPPRAGSLSQVQALAELPCESRPSKLIAVSCNPQTFVRDAEVLIGGGYRLEEVTMVDQFIYSNHSELVALFTNA